MRSIFPPLFILSFAVYPLVAGAQPDSSQEGINAVSPNDVYFVAPGAEQILEAQIQSTQGNTVVSWLNATRSTLTSETSIFQREFSLAGWSVPVQIQSSSRKISTLTSEITNQGDAQFAWVERQESGLNQLQFTDSTGVIQPVIQTPFAIDSVSIREIDSTTTLAWSEGGAGVFTSFLAYSVNNDWRVIPLSEEANAYDILPQVLQTTPPSVLWYSLQHSGFKIQQLQQNQGDWLKTNNQGLGFLPTERLPVLFDVPASALPGAFWIEPSPLGDQMSVFDPRNVESTQVKSLPKRTGVQHLDPEVAVHWQEDDSEIAFAWVEETAKDRYVIVRVRDQEYLVSSVPAPRQPRLAWFSDSELHLVVLSEQSLGGDGQLYFARVFLVD
ncbi:MAG: hypothetical protein ACFCU1_09770 [Sumerlaeia bacterium]